LLNTLEFNYDPVGNLKSCSVTVTVVGEINLMSSVPGVKDVQGVFDGKDVSLAKLFFLFEKTKFFKLAVTKPKFLQFIVGRYKPSFLRILYVTSPLLFIDYSVPRTFLRHF